MLRTVRRLRGAYDLPVTANNEADFRTVGVQYVHYPWNTLPRPDVEIRWYHISILLPLYYRLCRTLSGFAPAGAHRNLTLVNSDWTGRLAHRRHGFVCRTVYPPGHHRVSKAALRAHLAARAPLFSAERFMREIRAAVAEAAATP